MKARAVAQFRRPALNPRPPASSPAASPLPGFALPAGMQRWLAILLLVAAPLAALAPVCTHDFLNYDDFDQVAANPAYRPVTGHSLIEWWTAPRMDLYMPVTYTVWGIIALDAYHPAYNTTPAHLDPVPFHVANLLVHVMCGLVVFVLLEMLMRAGFTPPLGTPGGGRGGGERAARTNAAARGEASAPTLTPPRSTRGGEKSGPGFQAFGCIWPAVIGALLFELHPMQVEAVAWMSEFNTVLSALLALCAIWQYLRAVRTRGGSRGGPAWRWHYAAAMLLYLLATLAKPGAVVAPLIAGVLDVMILRRSWRESAKWLWPWAVLAVGCVLETVLFQNGGSARWNAAWYLRPLVALDSLAFYVQKLFWPRGLAVDYGLRPDVLLHDHWLIAKCVGLGGIGSLPWWIRRSGRPIAAGALLFLIPLLPVLGLITFDFQWYSNVADHYLYLPMLGAAMIAAWICRRWNRWPVYAAAAVILASLGIASNLRAAAWEDTDTLFGQDLKVNPTSALALNQFMLIAYQQNKEPLAMALAKKEIARHPDDVYAHRMMGLCYRAEPGKQAEAIEAFRKALALSPDDSLTLEDFAGVLAEAGRFAEAEKLARRSIVVDPDSADAYGNLGYILLQERKRSQAIDELRVASHLNANSTRNHDLLGQAFEESGKRQAAIEQYKAALRIDPQSAPALAGLRRLIGNDVNTQQSP